jgi:hypothetical protein
VRYLHALRIALAAIAAVVTSTAYAQDWGKLATISTTMGVSASRLCVGEASRGDIGCPAYAPSLTTAGDISISGNVSANKFIGDGNFSNVSATHLSIAGYTVAPGVPPTISFSGGGNIQTTLASGMPLYQDNTHTSWSTYGTLPSYLVGTFGTDTVNGTPDGSAVTLTISGGYALCYLMRNSSWGVVDLTGWSLKGQAPADFTSFLPAIDTVYQKVFAPGTYTLDSFSALYSCSTAVLIGSGSGGGGSATPAGSTADVQFNSGGALAADTGVFTYSSGLLKSTSISATNISATVATLTSIGAGNITASGFVRANAISASTAIQIGSNNLTCASGISGTMRYSQISSTMEYCNGSAWTSMGPSATVVPAFSYNKGGTAQTFAIGGVQVTWPNKVFDTNNNFASNKFTPTVPGIYILNVGGVVQSGFAGEQFLMSIRKNGTEIARGFTVEVQTGNIVGATASVVTSANGTGDYFDVMVYTAANSQTLDGGAHDTYFTGALISMSGGSVGGGTATPAGSDTYVQYNSGGSFAGSSALTWTAGTSTFAATNLSATTVKLTSTGSETCDAAHAYSLRINPATGMLQMCRP